MSSDLDRDAAENVLEAVYTDITTVAGSLTDAQLMWPSRCAGWAIGDVLYHQMLDARRALRAFASPSAEPPDTDYVTYWREYAPGGHSPPGDEQAAAHARHVRIVASAYPPGALAWEWRETSAAACRAARACPHHAVATQGHVLTTTDLIATLATEAAVHYLDITAGLGQDGPGAVAPRPDPAALTLVRQVLDGLLGTPMPGPWDDQTYALKGTGRLSVTEQDRAAVGGLAERMPLFG